MSLRDWFAGQALSGLLAQVEDQFVGDLSDPEAIAQWHRDTDRRWATFCYRIADAMLAARSKAGEP